MLYLLNISTLVILSKAPIDASAGGYSNATRKEVGELWQVGIMLTYRTLMRRT